MSRTKKNNLIIGGLLGVVLIMGIAYSAFATKLNITSTAETTKDWGVRIKSINPDKDATKTGDTYTSTGSISASKTNDLTATFEAALVNPGDSVEYDIVIENYGGLDAKLSSIVMPTSDNTSIDFKRSGIDEGNKIEASKEETLTLTVTYINIESGQSQPKNTTGNFSVSLNFVQDDGTGTAVSGGGSENKVYAWNTETITVGTSKISDLQSTKTSQPYYTSAEDVMSASGTTFYNMYTIENDTITEGYACQTFGILDEPVCLEGSTDGSTYGYDAGGNHTGNLGILKALQSNPSFTGSCRIDSDDSICYVGALAFRAYYYGAVYASGSGGNCDVFSGGRASCR